MFAALFFISRSPKFFRAASYVYMSRYPLAAEATVSAVAIFTPTSAGYRWSLISASILRSALARVLTASCLIGLAGDQILLAQVAATQL
jgi:hypothetical protein